MIRKSFHRSRTVWEVHVDSRNRQRPARVEGGARMVEKRAWAWNSQTVGRFEMERCVSREAEADSSSLLSALSGRLYSVGAALFWIEGPSRCASPSPSQGPSQRCQEVERKTLKAGGDWMRCDRVRIQSWPIRRLKSAAPAVSRS